jgi:hypothetical protein
MPKPMLEYCGGEVLTGSASRAARTVGAVSAGSVALAAIGLWTFARDPIPIKVNVTLVLFGFAGVATCAVSIAAAFTVARVQNGSLTFSFCGVRTRSIPLDAATTFQIRRIGRLHLLVITSGQKHYVPNGAFDKRALMEFLRLNGVVERPRA